MVPSFSLRPDRAIKEVSNAVNIDWNNNQACRLSQNIYVILNLFITNSPCTNSFKILDGGTGNSVIFLTAKKQTTKFLSAKFQKLLSPSYIILRIQRLEDKQHRS